MPRGIPKNGVNKGWFKVGCGKPFTAEHKKRISVANAGKKRTLEQKKLQSLRMIGKDRLGNPENWKHTKLTKNKISKANKGRLVGKKNPEWKGDNVGYVGIHIWVSKWKGKPNYCEQCGTTKKRKYEWCNVNHKYNRVLDDYIRMCTPCHRKYDKNL